MIYKVTLHGVKGQAYAQFEKSTLRYFINDLDGDIISLFGTLPINEINFKKLTGIKIQELRPRSASDKIALFMIAYKKHKQTTYRPTREERANIVHVTVNEQLLNAYFKSAHYPLNGLKSITDYIRHYNAVRDLAQNGAPIRSEFPNVYDREFEKHIGDDVSKLQRYWAHLRSLGWKKEDGVWKSIATAEQTKKILGL